MLEGLGLLSSPLTPYKAWSLPFGYVECTAYCKDSCTNHVLQKSSGNMAYSFRCSHVPKVGDATFLIDTTSPHHNARHMVDVHNTFVELSCWDKHWAQPDSLSEDVTEKRRSLGSFGVTLAVGSESNLSVSNLDRLRTVPLPHGCTWRSLGDIKKYQCPFLLGELKPSL